MHQTEFDEPDRRPPALGPVTEAIERLPAGQRAVIILRDIEGREAEEACELLGISAENQRVLLDRARGRIRQMIDELIDAPRVHVVDGFPAGVARSHARRPRAGPSISAKTCWTPKAGRGGRSRASRSSTSAQRF